MENSNSSKRPPMFTNHALLMLILPLIIEQFLAVAVGMADTAMVTGVGEAAVSAVSLVDSINTLLIQLFSAMSAGGSIIAAQYVGNRDEKNACSAAKQLFLSIFAIAFIVSMAAVWLNKPILRSVFGNLDPAIMEKAEAYFVISAVSYPFLALYNSGAGLMRAMGKTQNTMFISLLMNVINIGGNYFLINAGHPVSWTFFGGTAVSFNISFWCAGAGLGVAGAAWASLFSRAAAALIIIKMLGNHALPIHLCRPLKLRFDFSMVKRILFIGLPNGLENSLFQVGKLIIASLIATFSTSVIAANSISGSISGLVNLPGNAIGLATVTVIGQCMGAGELKQAKKYARKLMLLMLVGIIPTNLILYLYTPVFVGLFRLSAEGTAVAVELLKQYAVFSVAFWMPSFGMPNILRAAGDVRFTMSVSIFSMLICRLAFSYLFVLVLHMDLIGVWLAMYCDWIVRGACFIIRYLSGKWQRHKII